MQGALAQLLATHAGTGRVDWIGLRLVRRAGLLPVERVSLTFSGLEGDHASAGKRALTLIQAEHLPVIAALAHRTVVTPQMLRRNLAISGINLSALRGAALRIGTALVRLTGQCAPCSRIEEVLGLGGYNAMRGHGGWCAEVLEAGEVRLGDAVLPG